jgi:tetratricopeptide (TPR) repeat protein
LSEIDEDYLDKAFRVYDKYFNRSVEELPFEKISFEAHKAIGKILSLQSNYEESIKHYEYISQNIKNNRNCASAKLHNELGERF